MGSRPAKATPRPVTPPEPETKGTTTLDEHIDAPSVTAPGDGPADTADPTEVATSVTPDKAAAARDGHLTVNAVVPVDAPAVPADDREHRIEEYDATKPDGTTVRVRHDLDTGATELI